MSNEGYDTTTSQVWTIEARVTPERYVLPVSVGPMTLDTNWRDVPIVRTDWGVPTRVFCSVARERGYVSYETAMSLAYAVLATAMQDSVEVRLVEHEFVVKVTHKRVNELEAIQSYTFSQQHLRAKTAANADV